MLMRDLLKLGFENFVIHPGRRCHAQQRDKVESMTRILALTAPARCMSTASLGSDVVGHSGKVAGKDSYKAAKVSAKEAGKAGKRS